MTILLLLAILTCAPNILFAQQKCQAPKNEGKCPPTANATTLNNIMVGTRFYFNQEKITCLSFKYNGCGGNGNRFISYNSCMARCFPADMSRCYGAFPAFGDTEGETLTAPNCKQLKCPSGFVCRRNAFFAACCNSTVEEYYKTGFSPKCTDGWYAWMTDSRDIPEIILGDSCSDLKCPRGFYCEKTNDFFSKCCTKNRRLLREYQYKFYEL